MRIAVTEQAHATAVEALVGGNQLAAPVRYLQNRAATHPTAKRASTFVDEPAAERVVSQVLRRRADEIENWLSTNEPTERVDDVLDVATGISVDRAGVVSEVRGVRMALVRDTSMPDGSWIKTSFRPH